MPPTAQSGYVGWTPRDSAELYGIDAWGHGYFGVNDRGHITVRPDRTAEHQTDLDEIVTGLRDRGVATPMLLRFSDVLDHRLREIRNAFDTAIAENEYAGGYTCVYPIKVNQQRHIVEEVRDFGSNLGFGLEAGSKPELLAVLGLTANEPQDSDIRGGTRGGNRGGNRGGMPIVCNGFKDAGYIETVVLAAKLGRNIIPVIERPRELKMLLELCERYDVRPQIGIRVKPSAIGAGRWEASGGMRSKFGLSVSELLAEVENLREYGMLDCLKLLHFHIGSQVCEIKNLKNAVSELARTYTELVRLGAGLEMIDIGGGLGVDYDGSRSPTISSANYTIREYASDVVYRVKSACDDAGVTHPTILSESGRAMVAYSSVLIVDVLSMSRFAKDPDLDAIRADLTKEASPPQPVLDLLDAYERLGTGDVAEVYHDAMQARDEATNLFGLGYLSLPMRAAAERLFCAIGLGVLDRTPDPLPEELADLPTLLADIAYINMSVFQSLPDSWAIGHVFPVCPIHRLDEPPTRRATLADMTCDSDGQLQAFSDPSRPGPKPTLELHELRDGEPYLLGFFLIGAYQEVLGDLHNLFGDTHAVHVGLDETGRWSIDEIVEGDTVREVLSYVQYDADELRKAMRRDVERAVRDEKLGVAEGKSLLAHYEHGLDGYTYLE